MTTCPSCRDPIVPSQGLRSFQIQAACDALRSGPASTFASQPTLVAQSTPPTGQYDAAFYQSADDIAAYPDYDAAAFQDVHQATDQELYNNELENNMYNKAYQRILEELRVNVPTEDYYRRKFEVARRCFEAMKPNILNALMEHNNEAVVDISMSKRRDKQVFYELKRICRSNDIRITGEGHGTLILQLLS